MSRSCQSERNLLPFGIANENANVTLGQAERGRMHKAMLLPEGTTMEYKPEVGESLINFHLATVLEAHAVHAVKSTTNDEEFTRAADSSKLQDVYRTICVRK